jgi:hypothetical protein
MRKSAILAAVAVLALSGCGFSEGPELDRAGFIDRIGDFRAEYNEKQQPGVNEAVLHLIRMERKEYLKTMSKNFSNWNVELSQIRIDRDGKAHILFLLEGVYEVTIFGGGPDRMMLRAEVPSNDPVYRTISEATVGQQLQISGQFVVDGEDDFVDELSIYTEGSLRRPEFHVKISNVTIN